MIAASSVAMPTALTSGRSLSVSRRSSAFHVAWSSADSKTSATITLAALGPEVRHDRPPPIGGLARHDGTDVAAGLHHELLVRARDAIDKWRGARQRHDVVV